MDTAITDDLVTRLLSLWRMARTDYTRMWRALADVCDPEGARHVLHPLGNDPLLRVPLLFSVLRVLCACYFSAHSPPFVCFLNPVSRIGGLGMRPYLFSY